MGLEPGATREITWTVTPEQTADAMGHRGVHVFATPWVIAMLEQVCGDMITPTCRPARRRWEP
jgi:predicted thioesterase